MSEPRSAQPGRGPLIAIAGIIALVVIVAIIVVAVRGGTQRFDTDTPEGTVQAYLEAYLDDDFDGVVALVAPESATNCDIALLGNGADYRVSLIDSTVDGSSATVRVSLTRTYDSGPFSSSGYTNEDRFRLTEVDGQWRITQSPWDFSICEGITP